MQFSRGTIRYKLATFGTKFVEIGLANEVGFQGRIRKNMAKTPTSFLLIAAQ